MTKAELIAYNLVRCDIARTRAELSKAMGISRPTASTVAESLIRANLLQEGGKWFSTGGRNPTLLVVNASAYTLLGMDLGFRDRVSAVFTDAKGKILSRGDIQMSPDSPERAAEAIGRLWERLDPSFSARGLGLAVPGKFDPVTGVVSDCDHPAFGGDALIKLLRKRFMGKYVFASPRLEAAAVSERFCGAVEAKRDYMLLSLDEELETMFYLNGRCYTGARGNAGNLQNIPVTPHGSQSSLTIGQLLSADFMKKERPAPELLATLFTNGLRQILSILDIDLVVLSGRFLDFDEDFMPLLERRLAMLNCCVRVVAFGHSTIPRGAALQAYPGVL